VDVVFLALHVLAASVWVGGTIILVFVAVPYARTLPGDMRAQGLRALGRGWRLFGWSAMAVAVVSGIQLAIADGAFDDAGSDFDTVLAGALLHDFVLGPRLARQIREERPQTIRRTLVVVGWANLALTLTVPVLGAVLSHLS
jgi:putative copper export protein